MNQAQIHLALNHAPLFLSVLAGILLTISIIKKNDLVKTIALYGMIGAALFTIPVYLTGEGTEEIVEKFAVSEKAIEDHENFALISMILISISGAVAMLALFFKNRMVIFALVILAFISFGTMGWTAHLGGLIRHAELSTAGAGLQPQGDQGGEQQNKEKDDD